MALFRIDKFVGVNVNVESGEGVTSPTSIKSFLFDRTGGLVARLGAVYTLTTALGAGHTLIGYSANGLSAWSESASPSAVHLYNGTNLYSGTVANAFYVPQIGLSSPAVGTAYSESSAPVFIRDAGGAYRSSLAYTSISASQTTGGGSFVGPRANLMAVQGLPTDLGVFLADGTKRYSIAFTSGNAVQVTVSGAAPGTYTYIFVSETGDVNAPILDPGLGGIISGSGTLSVRGPGGTAGLAQMGWYVPEWAASPSPEFHRRRVWGIVSTVTARGWAAWEMPPLAHVANSKTLVYSEISYPNTIAPDNWLTIPFQASGAITAIRSSPAGLLVFGNAETFLVMGDPANPSTFQVKLVSGEIGHDATAGQPGVLGGAVFPIYNGRIYEMVFGMGDVDFGTGIKEIGYNVWDGSDGFKEVAGEARRNQLVARTTAGKIYRYDFHEKQWFNDPWTGLVFDPLVTNNKGLLPNPDSAGTRYVHTSNRAVSWVNSGSAASPSVAWTGLDMGDRGIKKHWRRVRIFTGSSYSGTPTLTYNISGSSGTISGTGKGGGRFVFVLPQGLVGERGDLTVALAGAVAGDQLKAPVEVEFAARYRQR